MDCPFCKLCLTSFSQGWYIAKKGVVFRSIWIHSANSSLVNRYKEQIEEFGVPLLVIEQHIGNKIIAEGLVGMTTEWFAEGNMRALKEFISGPTPHPSKYM